MSEHSPILKATAVAATTAAAIGAFAANPERLSGEPIAHAEAAHELVLPEAPHSPITAPTEHNHIASTRHRQPVTPTSINVPRHISINNHTPTVETNRHHHKPTRLPILKHPVEIPPRITQELVDLHPENLSVPGEVSQIMHDNVAYLPALGCSGFLVRDNSGTPIGVETAQHCSLLFKDGHWGKGSTHPTVNFSEPLEVYTGESVKNLEAVGGISQFVLNAPDDNKHDQVVGAFAGHTAQEVLDAYNANHLSVDDIKALKKGDVIYNSGWPVDQLNNPGAMNRQEYAMSVLGTTSWTITNGEQLNLLLAAVPEGKDGTECSWGDSGSEAFILKTTTLADGTQKEVPVSVGTLSAFNDFGMLYEKNPQSAAAEKSLIEGMFGVSMDGYAGVCGFAYETPSAEAGMITADVLAPEVQVVDSEVQAAIAAQAQQLDTNFFDPHATKNVIHGWLEIVGKGSVFVKDPVYSYDPVTQNLALAFPGIGKGGGDGLEILSFTGPEALQNLIVYGLDAQTPADITTTVAGELMPVDDVLADGFTDSSGLVIGQNLGINAPTTPTGQAYSFSSQNGQLSINIVEK